jgi:dTDP-4-amino-4,6-dideoxygalactose transaminase
MHPIPFNRPAVSDRALNYLRRAVESGHHSGDGEFTKQCSQWLEKRLGAAKVLLTTSCTHALEMSAILLDVRPGDEVIVPSFTFVSTVNAFVLRGAKPIFCDIRPDTLNINEREVERLITRRTKAIVPVHYAGVGCEMDELMKLADDAGVPVIEDNAHGLFGEYRHEPLGSFGRASTLSFHETKNVSCGEGGAIVLNDAAWIERAEILREKGTNRSRFFRGQVDKYSWVDVGSSYLPSDLLAAMLLDALEQSDGTQARRRAIWNRYADGLCEWASDQRIGLPSVPKHVRQAYHMFHLMLPSLADRTALIAHLKSQGIHAVFHYQPLHLSDMGRTFGGLPGDCPVTERAGDCLLRLPFHAQLTIEDQDRVIEAVSAFRCRKVEGRRPSVRALSGGTQSPRFQSAVME